MFHTSVLHLIRDFSYLPVNCPYVIRHFCLCVYFRPHRSFYIFQENLTNQKSKIILLVATWLRDRELKYFFHRISCPMNILKYMGQRLSLPSHLRRIGRFPRKSHRGWGFARWKLWQSCSKLKNEMPALIIYVVISTVPLIHKYNFKFTRLIKQQNADSIKLYIHAFPRFAYRNLQEVLGLTKELTVCMVYLFQWFSD